MLRVPNLFDSPLPEEHRLLDVWRGNCVHDKLSNSLEFSLTSVIGEKGV